MNKNKIAIFGVLTAVLLGTAIRWKWQDQAHDQGQDAAPAQNSGSLDSSSQSVRTHLDNPSMVQPSQQAEARKMDPEVYAVYGQQSQIARKLQASNQAVFGQLKFYLDNTTLSAEQKEQVLKEAARHLDAESLEIQFQAHLAQTLSESEILELADSHKNPLLQKVSAREDEILSAEGNQKLADYLKAKDPQTVAARRKLLQALNEEFDLFADAAKLYDLAMQPYRDGAFKKFGHSPEMLSRIESYMKTNMKESFIASLAYLSQDLTDEELREYVEITQSKLMTKEREAIVSTYGAAINMTSQSYQVVLSSLTP